MEKAQGGGNQVLWKGQGLGVEDTGSGKFTPPNPPVKPVKDEVLTLS